MYLYIYVVFRSRLDNGLWVRHRQGAIAVASCQETHVLREDLRVDIHWYSTSLGLYVQVYGQKIYRYIYIYMYVYVYICIYIYI